MANVGGSSLASQVMLLGREYYQTPFGEKYLVILPFFAHITAVTLKRIISPRKPRPWTHTLTVTGFFAANFLVPKHYLIHRVFPQDPTPPIEAFGPSQMDFEFVKTGLAQWPIRNWIVYSALAATIVVHMTEGMPILLRRAVKGAKTLSKRGRRLMAGAIVLPVLSGLLVMAREPLMTFPSTALRYQATFAKHPLFQF
ncbi:unnamed protein product [Peniophora sp. CBMAI 1063]|nr:unnamed protein product [Peniophora sp. CBMAI 1063]